MSNGRPFPEPMRQADAEMLAFAERAADWMRRQPGRVTTTDIAAALGVGVMEVERMIDWVIRTDARLSKSRRVH